MFYGSHDSNTSRHSFQFQIVFRWSKNCRFSHFKTIIFIETGKFTYSVTIRCATNVKQLNYRPRKCRRIYWVLFFIAAWNCFSSCSANHLLFAVICQSKKLISNRKSLCTFFYAFGFMQRSKVFLLSIFFSYSPKNQPTLCDFIAYTYKYGFRWMHANCAYLYTHSRIKYTFFGWNCKNEEKKQKTNSNNNNKNDWKQNGTIGRSMSGRFSIDYNHSRSSNSDKKITFFCCL